MSHQIGQPVSEFCLFGIDAEAPRPREYSLQGARGAWLMLIFYPRDFSFVCPTELTAFSARIAEFRQRQCQLLGVSVEGPLQVVKGDGLGGCLTL